MPPKKKPTPWGKSKAKALLRRDIVDKIVKPDMDAAFVFTMRPEYQDYYLFRNFKTNLKNLRDAIAEGRGPKPPSWGPSQAKKLLREDIINEVVTSEMDPAFVFAMRPEYQDYKFANFTTNLKNLTEVIAKHHQRMKDDCKYYIEDRKLLKQFRMMNPRVQKYPNWHQSEAQRLLKVDVDHGRHTIYKPSELYLAPNRAAYRDFPPDVFRKHLHQEVDERASKAFRFEKKKLRPRGPAPPNPPSLDYY